MKIYDCFIFYNEMDILEMRLEELYPVVDQFVIVEGTHTFQGEPHEPASWEILTSERFRKYKPKLGGLIVRNGEGNLSPWDREYLQRNAIKNVLEVIGPEDDDIILLSDADEIPRRSVVAALDPQPVQSIALDTYYYGLNISGGHCHTNRAARWSYARTMSMQELRTLDPPPNIVYDGGWHFSYLGSPEHIANKFKAFAHSELNRPDTTDVNVLIERMKSHSDLWGDGHSYTQVEIDDTWPEAVKRNRTYWSKYEW